MTEENTATDPVELGDGVPAEPAAEPSSFDWSSPLPLDEFPEGMRESMKGKTIKDFAADHAKFRQAASKLGARNKELEAEIAKTGDRKSVDELSEEELDELTTERQEKQMVQTPDYQEVLSTYIETDEIPEDFLDAVEKHGIKVSRRDVEKFLSFYKQDRQQKIDHITSAADGVEGQDLWDWLSSGECQLSADMRKGFHEQAEEDDYGWVGLAAKKYNEWVEGGGKPAGAKGGGRFSRGPVRRGRAPTPRPGEGDISAEDFSTEWQSLSRQQAAGQISKADEVRGKRVLEQRRRRTTGE